MISKGLLLLFFIHLINSQIHFYECDFDYGQKCLTGLSTTSFVLLNETINELRQPASDISSIQTSNEQGECFFPFQINSFDMFFCEKNDLNLPATCPIFNSTGPRINCTEGEYGYEKYESTEIGSRSYQLDLTSDLLTGEHCIRFYYYLSDQYSNATITVILHDTSTITNTTILILSSHLQNRWHEFRAPFHIFTDKPIIYFLFQRDLSNNSLPFYIAIDQIEIIDLECEPLNTTTTTTTQSTTLTTTITTTTISSTMTTLSTSRTTIPSINSTTISTTFNSTRTSTTTMDTRSTSTTLLTSTSTLTSTSSLTTTTTTTITSFAIQIRSKSIVFIVLFIFSVKKIILEISNKFI